MQEGMSRNFFTAVIAWLIAAGALRADVLVMRSGSKTAGKLISVSEAAVEFDCDDGRRLSCHRAVVFGVFADGAPPKLMEPDPKATGDLRVGNQLVKGTVLRYKPGSAFAIVVKGRKADVALFRASDEFVYLRCGEAVPIGDVDRGSAFCAAALRGMKALAKDRIDMALLLGKCFADLKPSGTGLDKANEFLEKLKVAWRTKARELFSITDVNIESVEDRTFIIFHIRSERESFDDLECTVSAMLEDGTVCSSSFLYYTRRKSKAHHDSVEPRDNKSRVAHWRVELKYLGEVAALKTSVPEGPAGWWSGRSVPFQSWELNPKTDKPDTYFSMTLGKRKPKDQAVPR